MSDAIPHSRPTLPVGPEWEQVTSRLVPGWIADGPCVAAFEAAAAEWLGCPGGVAVASGSVALQLVLSALGAGPGREVLIPAYCCAALLNAVALTGAVPVLVDAEPGGFQICPTDTSRRITPRTAAVVVAHLFGEPVPMQPFLDLGVPVVEDCAQSLGAREGSEFTGARGHAAITSFYATKVITTGHGGLATGRDPELPAGVRDRVEYDNREEWEPRLSCRISELQAAHGLWQLERLPAWLVRRRALATFYDECLRGAGRPIPHRQAAGAIFYRYVVRVPDADRALQELAARGIGARRPVFRPLHRYFPDLAGAYPHADAADREIVSLPLYPGLTEGEATRVMTAFLAL